MNDEQEDRLVRNDAMMLFRNASILSIAFCLFVVSPVSGEGTGGSGFSWTAAMWLAWCGDRTG